MELKSSVKNRQRERIRELEAGGRSRQLIDPVLPESYSGIAPADAGMPERAVPSYDKRWDDPEFVWKEREKRLFDNPRRYGGGGRYDDGLPPRLSFTFRRTAFQLVASLILFAAVWFLFRTEGDLPDKGKQAVRQALTDEFPFARLEAWYGSTFGDSASWLPAFGGSSGPAAKVGAGAAKNLSSPVRGTVVLHFGSAYPGVLLQTLPEAPVYAVDQGRLIYAGQRQDTGYTLVVEHAGGLESTYGYLQPGKWEKGDWVQGGDLLGKSATRDEGAAGNVYFAVRRNQTAVNPEDVVRFD